MSPPKKKLKKKLLLISPNQKYNFFFFPFYIKVNYDPDVIGFMWFTHLALLL